MHSTATGPTVTEDIKPTIKPRNTMSIMFSNISFSIKNWSQKCKLPRKYIKNILKLLYPTNICICILCALCNLLLKTYFAKRVCEQDICLYLYHQKTKPGSYERKKSTRNRCRVGSGGCDGSLLEYGYYLALFFGVYYRLCVGVARLAKAKGLLSCHPHTRARQAIALVVAGEYRSLREQCCSHRIAAITRPSRLQKTRRGVINRFAIQQRASIQALFCVVGA